MSMNLIPQDTRRAAVVAVAQRAQKKHSKTMSSKKHALTFFRFFPFSTAAGTHTHTTAKSFLAFLVITVMFNVLVALSLSKILCMCGSTKLCNKCVAMYVREHLTTFFFFISVYLCSSVGTMTINKKNREQKLYLSFFWIASFWTFGAPSLPPHLLDH